MKVWVIGVLHVGFTASYAPPRMGMKLPETTSSSHSSVGSTFRMTEEQGGLSLRELVQRDRLIRKAGVGAGVIFVASAAALGSNAGLISGDELLRAVLCGGILAVGLIAAKFLSNEEAQPPCPASFFEVAPSPGKGKGLFATCTIEPGTYLFDYEGEVLDEDAFFARYPNADGRYIAGITNEYYIDGKASPTVFCICCAFQT